MSDTSMDPSPGQETAKSPAPSRDRGLDFVFKVTPGAGGRMSDYYWNGVHLMVGDSCIIEEDGRLEIGSVALAKRPYLGACAKKTPMGKIIRKATAEDIDMSKKLIQKEREALVFCKEKAAELGLKMSVSRACFSFDEKKAVFFFTSETRVDFRELVKDLNNYTRIKVELRQIGVRDKARILGGCGPCGQELCCSGFLTEFLPVSIRMAKNQFLALSPEKISGVCGRLLCCLSYENDVYVELQKKAPKLGKAARAPDGRRGKVCQVNLLTDKISVAFEEGAKVEFDASQFSPAGEDGILIINAPREVKPPAEDERPMEPFTAHFGQKRAAPADMADFDEEPEEQTARAEERPSGVQETSHPAEPGREATPRRGDEPRSQRRRGRRGRRRPGK